MSFTARECEFSSISSDKGVGSTIALLPEMNCAPTESITFQPCSTSDNVCIACLNSK